MGCRRSERHLKTSHESRLAVPIWAVIGLAGLMLGAVGCGNTLYAIQVNSASSKVEEAKELGAEKYAPYEYYYARAHLVQAEKEAAEANYGDATDLAEASEEYATKAITLARQAHRGAGR